MGTEYFPGSPDPRMAAGPVGSAPREGVPLGPGRGVPGGGHVPSSAVVMLSGGPAARMFIFHLESPAPFLLLGGARVGFFLLLFSFF